MTASAIGVARALVLAILVASPALVEAAPAADRDGARALYEQGRRKFDVKLYAEALKDFRGAYQAAPLPAFLYNIALCEDRLGDLDAAIESLNHYLARVEPGTDLAEARAFQRDLEARRERARRSAQLAPTTKPPTPTYKRWWPWTLLAGGVVVGVGLGVGLGLGLRDPFSPTLAPVNLRPAQ